MQRHSFRSARLAALVVGSATAALSVSGNAQAQVAGSTSRPLPDVMLLVDNSGSMERMPNNQLPADAGATCTPGTATEPNRWGMLLQALTGNIQPFYSCAAVTRASGSAFDLRYRINNLPAYDVDYTLPYHQPLSGATSTTACAVTPWHLPGATSGSGVGPARLGAGGVATDFPDNALASVHYATLGNGITATTIPAGDKCTFEQSNDGQLDVARDYARFALMTFDSSTHGGTGLSGGNVINTARPFDGMWSYLRFSSSADYSTRTCTSTNAPNTNPCPSDVFTELDWARGRPSTSPACLFTPQEVGARNAGAPPWEGRLVPFPPPDASLYELAAHNERLQQVLVASRPYGATPIDGMLDDARSFFWNDPAGPKDDPYGCRQKYMILLTDGAPNLDLRVANGCTNDADCPYELGTTIANKMFKSSDPLKRVTTYVIGFSVNGAGPGVDGFPAGISNCKQWFDTAAGAASTEKAAAEAMQAACSPMPAEGTTGYACCKLNDLALAGSETGAYFAESQADVVLAFGRIMANIIHNASTKTIPALSPSTRFSAAATYSASGSVATSAQFIGTYIPSSQRPWSGELDRTRYACNSSNQSVPVLPQDSSKGDFMSENVAQQSASKKRLFLSVLAEPTTGATPIVDSAATIRPYANDSGTPSSTGADGITKPDGSSPTYKATEVSLTDPLAFDTTTWPAALNITKDTCKRGRAVSTGTRLGRGTTVIPALDDPTTGPPNCTKVVWGFATATPDSISLTGSGSPSAYEFNVRCRGNTASAGTCSISGTTCTPAAVPSTCPTGEVCVPTCAALGAIYHSNASVIPPPNSLLREDGFRNYQANRATRKMVTYVATTDGILHAFKSLDEGGPDTGHELWAFVPPAVLPRLASNYPGGNQVLLDGSPVVRETVWDRPAGGTQSAAQWHSTLVAGLGTTGGYYALNVTDSDCNGSGDCAAASGYQNPGSAPQLKNVATSGDPADTDARRGPHFLWQLTDVQKKTSGTDPAKVHRTSKLGGASGTSMVALFGKNTSTPAVGTVIIRDAGNTDRQVGVAILPGGYDDPPIPGGTCARRTKPASDPFQSGYSYADRTPRGYVRQWAKACTDPVPGRGVTVVRLDNGEIIAHFGRKDQDVPGVIADDTNKMIDTPFDSPMVGTPVLFPDQVGVPFQRAYIGDADGTLWRLDFTSTDPKKWRANLFSDLYAVTTSPAAGDPAAGLLGHPMQVPPVLSLDENGQLIINAATGDQESLVASTDRNYVVSIREARDSVSFVPKAQTNWWQLLANSERVTGPMTVFDRVLYFASHQPRQPASGSNVCTGLGLTQLWGLHYTAPTTAGDPASGGRPEWCKEADIDSITGVCKPSATKVANVIPVDDLSQPITDIIPGVALTASTACVQNGATDEYGNGGYSSVSQASYSLTFGITRPGGANRNTQADRKTLRRPVPNVPTRIDSWALVLQ